MREAPLRPRRFAAALWAVLFLLATLAQAETLRLATYNVENYGMADRMTEAGYRKDYPKPEAAKRAPRASSKATTQTATPAAHDNVSIVIANRYGSARRLVG